MDAWTIGLGAIIVVGLGAIIFGALYDRARNKRRAQEILAPPARPIPRFAPDAPAPHYLSDLQARRPPPEATATDLTAAERQEIEAAQTDPATVLVKVGYLGPEFVTDETSGWAVLDQPMIMVCADPVQTVRELLVVLEKLIVIKAALVIVAPSFTREVEATLAVNQIRQTMRLLPVSAGPSQLEVVAAATGAHRLVRTDLQSGYVLPEHLGHARRWVSSRTQSYIIGPPHGRQDLA